MFKVNNKDNRTTPMAVKDELIFFTFHFYLILENNQTQLLALKVIKVAKLNLKRFSHTVRETKPLVVF